MTAPTRATSATTAPPEAADALGLTLEPIETGRFLAEHWDRGPLLVVRGEAGRFEPLLSTADAQRLVAAQRLRAPGFRLVRDGAQVPLGSYTNDIPWRPGSFTDLPVVDRVAEEFAAGATLVLQALHLHWPPAARYCRGLEWMLACPVQANAYWTPPAAQGFAVHHDTHDVFVLQVSGRKRWRVYEPVLELPLKDQRWPGGDAGRPVMDFVLGPGDTLYLPRGWPHEAETSEDASLHLTIGLHPPTRLDALRAALTECADDVQFRRALDGGMPTELIARLADRIEADAVAARARRRFVMGRQPILEDQIEQVQALPSLTLDTRLRRRPTVIADLAKGVLYFEGKRVAFPPQAHVALEAIHARWEPFSAGALPGGLDGEGRLVLVRRLIREGYLMAVG